MSPKPPDILRKSHRHTERKQRAVGKDRLRRDVAAAIAERKASGAYAGRCGCGAIGYRYFTNIPTAAWSIRACDCERCRRSRAVYTSDPAGSVEFFGDEVENAGNRRAVGGYSGFLSCRHCGDLLAALMHSERGAYAHVNVNRLDDPPPDLPAAESVSLHDGPVRSPASEWTPVAEPDESGIAS